MTGYQKYGFPANAGQVDSFTPGPDLHMPGSRPKFQNFTLTAGTYAKGAVLGMVTATRKLLLAASAAGDGSQAPMAVLDRALVLAADATFDVMVSGAVLNPAALVLGTGTTSNAAQDALRTLGFQFRTPGFSG